MRIRCASLQLGSLAITLILSGLVSHCSAKGPAYADPEKTDPDFTYQGEYSGEIQTAEGRLKLGVQVVAQGEGKFRSVAYLGGLPGDGWTGGDKPTVDGTRTGEALAFEGDLARGEIRDRVLHIKSPDGSITGKLPKVARQSPTLGQKPPAGAVVLFDGSSIEGWDGGRMTDDKLLMEGCTSKQKFGSHRLHLEFRLPYMPQDAGQARGNSGLYLQGRYEVQMLDSFGLEGKDNECGGIYSVRPPAVNMCLPPLTWQTYDVDFTAARYEESGKLVAKPRVTVRHNGVVIHDEIELPGERNTTAAPVPAGPEPGPIYLQNHGDPVRYRNIWVVPR